MDASEFWCRAFLTAMGGSYAEHGTWDNHGSPATYCERAADAALAVAQRRGMVTGGAEPRQEPELERVEFTAERLGPSSWILQGAKLPSCGLTVLDNDERAQIGSALVRIKWNESAPPKPIEVWIERKAGA